MYLNSNNSGNNWSSDNTVGSNKTVVGKGSSDNWGMVDHVAGGVGGDVLLDRDLGNMVDLMVDIVANVLDNGGGGNGNWSSMSISSDSWGSMGNGGNSRGSMGIGGNSWGSNGMFGSIDASKTSSIDTSKTSSIGTSNKAMSIGSSKEL